jgi:amino acid permease
VGTIVGGGVVGLPKVYYHTGLILGLSLNFIIALMNIYSVHLLTLAKNITGLASYSELGYACFGRGSIFVVNSLIALSAVGMPIAYFMIFGHICPMVLVAIGIPATSFFSSYTFCVLSLSIIVFFFYIQKKISEIKIAGMFLFFGIIAFTVILLEKVMFEGQLGTFPDDYNILLPQWSSTSLWAHIPTMFLAYSFQQCYYTVYESLQEKRDINGLASTIYSIASCMFIYGVVGSVGLLAYGEDLKGDIMQNISNQVDKGLSNYFLMALFMLIAAMHIPIVFFIGKEAVLIIIDEIMRESSTIQVNNKVKRGSMNLEKVIRENLGQPSTEAPHFSNMPDGIYYFVAILMYALVVILAITLPNISIVFGIIGSTSVSFVVFIAPGAYVLRGA